MLYFSSDGHPGMGGLDIFCTKYDEKKKDWSQPENMKYPVNSFANDYAMVWEEDAMRGYFTSDRPGGKGGDDIYSFVLPPLEFALRVMVVDMETDTPLAGSSVTLRSSDGMLVTLTTDSEGYVFFDKNIILHERDYFLRGERTNFLSGTGKESTAGLTVSTRLEHKLKLKGMKKIFVLPDIYYGVDSAILRPESFTSLDKLVEILNENPKIVIELSSHTDTRASEKHNDVLSLERARSAVTYLISKGIDPARLVARGYGERIPRVLTKDDSVLVNNKWYYFKTGTKFTDAYIQSLRTKDEQEAAHQMNRRTEFRVLREDFLPKREGI
jgi:peptidoglycan-associated lipoprotein